ncbi:hypothetical protein H7X46_07895 [Pseudonocardia sp. C8]|uniref:hypothetical protein n=1 Tax=Pseudonocardia sp. C8 TaxID=2762759 RepID=UPI0016429FB1|nr:hypothetical protein [Pseudonocardia sp. C8]MBC3190982.1 hypothetical protein [Pseudonocardia sp. C8]
MRWRVGVLRPDAENVDWTATGQAPEWVVARRRALDALAALITGEGRCQEYRLLVDTVPVVVWPGITDDGTLDVRGIDDVLPADRYGAPCP